MKVLVRTKKDQRIHEHLAVISVTPYMGINGWLEVKQTHLTTCYMLDEITTYSFTNEKKNDSRKS